jgi:hypothetical protein
MKVVEFKRADDGPEMVAKTLQHLADMKPTKLIAVAISAQGEYHLLGGNVSLTDMLWLIERGREIVLEQEGTE